MLEIKNYLETVKFPTKSAQIVNIPHSPQRETAWVRARDEEEGRVGGGGEGARKVWQVCQVLSLHDEHSSGTCFCYLLENWERYFWGGVVHVDQLELDYSGFW